MSIHKLVVTRHTEYGEELKTELCVGSLELVTAARSLLATTYVPHVWNQDTFDGQVTIEPIVEDSAMPEFGFFQVNCDYRLADLSVNEQGAIEASIEYPWTSEHQLNPENVQRIGQSLFCLHEKRCRDGLQPVLSGAQLQLLVRGCTLKANAVGQTAELATARLKSFVQFVVKSGLAGMMRQCDYTPEQLVKAVQSEIAHQKDEDDKRRTLQEKQQLDHEIVQAAIARPRIQDWSDTRSMVEIRAEELAKKGI